MTDTIYRVKIRRYHLCPIEKLEVVRRTAKTVTVILKDFWHKGKNCESRYSLESQDYLFFDTLKEAENVAENIITNRMQESITETEELRERLQEICKHVAINSPSDGRCCRCDFRVTNPEDYCNGG